MKTQLKNRDDAFPEIEDYQVERALVKAALDAIHRARRCGTDFVIEQNGRTICLNPTETQEQEKINETLSTLNKKIEELQAQESGALSLNDRPRP
ncbi:MAG TPA: hypothetical protein VHH88_10780 [Verrucomicrobiae bacterium]|nr:hypothetical protein [Verrucomicrobiae bacterium]